jgi:hypothetical protein
MSECGHWLEALIEATASLFGATLSPQDLRDYCRTLLPVGAEAAADAVRAIPSRHREWPTAERVLATARAAAREEARVERDMEAKAYTRAGQSPTPTLKPDNPFEQLALQWERERPVTEDEHKARLKQIHSMLGDAR